MALNFVEKIDNAVKIKNILISVSDKTGLDTFIPRLLTINPDVTIYSTGGTYSKLKEIMGTRGSGTLLQVSEYTGQPEMQGGLVKTLDFKIYLGLLSETYNPAHQDDLKRVQGVNIDMVIVNLYPFAETIAKADSTAEMARANIDIGGPCMIRASAKNYLRVASVTNPEDYPLILKEMEEHQGMLSFERRLELAKKAFDHTANYDTHISKYFAKLAAEKVKEIYNFLK
ncbi:MAG: hypothetical protein JXR70_07155 [Spirochaetales bacterium]|nr:hypothetical protein [Spirochaetales bacterium]